MEKRKSSVFTKGQVHNMWVEFLNELKTMKSVKEVRELAERRASESIPQKRGRGASVDYGAIQRFVEQARSAVVGGKASTLAHQVCLLWNKQSDNNYLLTPQKVKTFVEKGKLKFPDEFMFTKRLPKATESLVVAGSNESSQSEVTT